MIQLHSINDSVTYHPWLSNIPSMIQLHPIHDSTYNVHSIHDSVTFHPWLYSTCNVHPIHDCATFHPWLCYVPPMTLLHPSHDSATSHPWLCNIPFNTLLHHVHALFQSWLSYTLLTPLHLLESAAVHLRWLIHSSLHPCFCYHPPN